MPSINDPAAAETAEMNPGAMSDPVLDAAEQKIEAGLQSEIRDNYLKIVVAGFRAAQQGGDKSIAASLLKSKDPVSDAAKGAVALVLILRRESKGTMPLQAMIPAAMTLMLHALDLVNRAGLAKVGASELDRATTIFANTILHSAGITPPMLAHAAQQVNEMTQDPVKLQKLQLKAGMVKHPDALEPTQIPAAQPGPPAGGTA